MQYELPLKPTTGDLPFPIPRVSQCANCGVVVQDPIIKQYYSHRCVRVEHFCSDSCHHTWYVNRLRSFGL